jgi:hypothetical protein
VLRIALLILVSLLIFTTTEFKSPGLIWPCLLAVAALPAWTPPRNPVMVPLGRLAEVAIIAIGASALAVVHDPLTGAVVHDPLIASALLPYLLVPVILPVLEGRMAESLTLLGIAALLLGVAGAISIHPDTRERLLSDPQYVLAALEWLAIAGLSSAFVYSVQRRVTTSGEPGPQPYAEATRLLTQLRTVARQLPGATLDPGGLAEHLIEEVRAIAPLDRAVVLSGGGGGGRLVILAESAVERVDWETSLDADSAIADAWASQQPQVSNRSQARSRGRGEVSSLVVPLAAGVRTIGLIALEADQAGAYPPHLVARINSLAAPAALRLEAALLFDDVRSLATNEERQRLAGHGRLRDRQRPGHAARGRQGTGRGTAHAAGRGDPGDHRAAAEPVRAAHRCGPPGWTVGRDLGVRPDHRRRRRAARALLAGGVHRAPADRRGGGTPAHRPGSDHQRP